MQNVFILFAGTCLFRELALLVIFGHLAEDDKEAEDVDSHHGQEIGQRDLVAGRRFGPRPVPAVEERGVAQDSCMRESTFSKSEYLGQIYPFSAKNLNYDD